MQLFASIPTAVNNCLPCALFVWKFPYWNWLEFDFFYFWGQLMVDLTFLVILSYIYEFLKGLWPMMVQTESWGKVHKKCKCFLPQLQFSLNKNCWPQNLVWTQHIKRSSLISSSHTIFVLIDTQVRGTYRGFSKQSDKNSNNTHSDA